MRVIVAVPTQVSKDIIEPIDLFNGNEKTRCFSPCIGSKQFGARLVTPSTGEHQWSSPIFVLGAGMLEEIEERRAAS